ncbi:pyridoxamine 5'-phosphate oxidase family protein [Candidatus Curtissbacteria bacterium]|nr:pyridoxamine 5'-phosphate oxidase family protein [Candidatus Curtissbacteria bacterium]
MGDLAEKAKQIISKIIYITIATTSKDGQPWNSPVYSAYDDKYNIDFRKEYYSHSKGPMMKGMKEYCLNLEQIDEFVKKLLIRHVTPGWIRNLVVHGDSKAQYERENLHIIYQ